LFEEAGISWKKQRNNPKKTQNWSKKKKRYRLVKAHRAQIVSGQLVVFFVDECHLLWGDLCGYVWGKLMSASKFPSSMNAASKPTMEPLISALSNV